MGSSSGSMIFRTRAWRVARSLLVLSIALATIVLVYAMGLPDVGGALLLSGLLLVLALYVKSGALSPVCLQRRHFSTIRNRARWEFTRAMICAGVGLDILRLIGAANDRFYILNSSPVSVAAFFVVIAVWLIGTGAFLVRSFAAYLLSLRP